MADTIRSLSALQTILADNTSGLITPQNVRDFLVSVDPEDSVTKSTYALRNGNQKAGFLQLYSDGIQLGRDNGGAIEYWGPIFPLVDPNLQSWSWVNQGNATINTTPGGIFLSSPSTTSPNARIRKKSIPSSPYTIVACIIPYLTYNTSFTLGILLRKNSTGAFVSNVIRTNSGSATTFFDIASQKWDNETTFNAHYTTFATFLQSPIFLRIKDDNTNRIMGYSFDGQNFIDFHTVGRTDFITPDECGFFVYSNNISTPIAMNLISWQET